MKLTDSIKPPKSEKEQENSFASTISEENQLQPVKPVASSIPDYFQHAKVFGVLPVDETSGELRTGISFKLDSGEIVWLNLSCSDAEWLCVTLRSWMSDYETRKAAETSSAPEDAR